MFHWFARRMKEARENEQGFTLIELLVVVIIIGILAAIAIPTFLSQRDKANDADAVSGARNAATAAKALSTECGGLYYKATACTADLDAAAIVASDSSLSKYNGAANPKITAVTVSNSGKDITIKVTSKSTKVATFSSATGDVTVAAS